jgi:hypothetical protein
VHQSKMLKISRKLALSTRRFKPAAKCYNTQNNFDSKKSKDASAEKASNQSTTPPNKTFMDKMMGGKLGGMVKEYGMFAINYWLFLYIGGFGLCYALVKLFGLSQWEFLQNAMKMQTYVEIKDEYLDLLAGVLLNEIAEIGRVPLLLLTIARVKKLLK